MSEDKLASETYGHNIRRTYAWNSGSHSVSVTSKRTRWWSSLSIFFRTVFLPHGYPESVSKDYFQYQVWDSVQAFASSITGSLATHTILQGAGVGDESASALAATMTFLMKDGTSMLGRFVFCWLHGTKLDTECKKWRLVADVLNDLALFLDLLAAHLKQHFLIIVCFSGVLKSVVGVAGGATRSALTQHQARRNNVADVSAKDGNQETLVNLLALLCSLVLVPAVAHSTKLIWFTYCVMTVIHISANYYAVKSVLMEIFNAERYHTVVDHFVNSNTDSRVLGVEQVNKMESVFPSFFSDRFAIKLGVSLSDAVNSNINLKELLRLYDCNSCGYLIYYLKDVGEINVCFHPNISVKTQLEAMYQACLLSSMLSPSSMKFEDLQAEFEKEKIKDKDNANHCENLQLHAFTRKKTIETFHSFIEKAEQNHWRTDVTLFYVDLWRIVW